MVVASSCLSEFLEAVREKIKSSPKPSRPPLFQLKSSASRVVHGVQPPPSLGQTENKHIPSVPPTPGSAASLGDGNSTYVSLLSPDTCLYLLSCLYQLTFYVSIFQFFDFSEKLVFFSWLQTSSPSHDYQNSLDYLPIIGR